ncbi:MAG: amidohydrolase family protein [Phycisphaerales bacterium]|nr:amidohydrolase family protein [Phycisphaerales bacterium]
MLMSVLPEPIIDFHVHLFPDRLFDAIWRYFQDRIGLNVLYRLYYRECVDYLRAQGVGTIVYSNYAHKEGLTRVLNEWNRRVLDEIPNLFCFAPYHPDDGDALAMAEAIIDHPRILGFKLQLVVQQLSPCDNRLYPLYELLIAKKKRLLIHVGTGPVKRSDIIGVHPFRKVLRRFPELQANSPHMGGLEFEEFGELLSLYPSVYLDTAFSFVPGTPYRFPLGNDFLEAYKNRILYGSDFPNMFHSRETEIEHLLDMRLSSDFYSRVFRENGLTLLPTG